MSEVEAILLLIVSIGAFLMPFISSRLNLPSPVAEIIFGLIIGLIFKDIIHQTEIVNFLGELGFIILMYLAGLEINFEKIKILTKKEKIVFISVIFILITLSVAITLYLNLKTIYILVLLTTAIGLLYPVLKDTGLLNQHFGQIMLIIGSIGEVISLMAITIFFVVFKYGLSTEALKHLLAIYMFFMLAYIILKLFKLYIWWNPDKVNTFLKARDISETSVRANFMNMFVFVGLASLLGLEPIIGAFFGGMLFALIFKERHQITEKLSSFGYGFLIPIFFIDVGLRFNILELMDISIIKNALMLSLIILVIRFLSSLLLISLKLSIKEVVLSSLALSVPLTLLVAISTLGYEINMLNKQEALTILLTAIFTALVYPWIFKNIINAYR